jgi:membrane-bound lytic murein transglycosylase MltF
MPGLVAVARGEEAADEAVDPLLASALRPWTGDLDGMVERGMVRVAIPVGLATYFLEGPDQKGITYDRVVELEKQLKQRLGKAGANLTVVIVPTGRDRLFDLVRDGRADIAAGNLTVTPQRALLVEFSEPFRKGVRELLVTGPAAPPLGSVEDLVGTPIHVRRSSSFFEHLTAVNERRLAAGKPPFMIAEADENLQVEDLFEMVNTGLLKATIADEPAADFLVQIFDKVTIHEKPELAVDREIAWAFRKGSPKLAQALDEFAATVRVGSRLGNIILAKYLKSTKWTENALGEEDRRRFAEMAEFVKAYAQRYDFDWLMIAAQGYQESRLDQSKRSRVGAVGVMQVMPATARDPNVGVADIHLLEPNIHAGVKYLRFLRDRYFSDSALSALDRTMFAFAAYNAGPANVAKARKRTAAMGLDPDVWFDNVEIAAAKTISREPVTYCRNIYKYYVAYKLLAAQG